MTSLCVCEVVLTSVCLLCMKVVVLSGGRDALFSDGECVGHVTPARDSAVKQPH